VTQPSAPVTVTRDDEAGRYEVRVGDELGGFTEFERDDEGRLVFPHTEIDPAFAGHGLGSTLVGEAMRDAAAQDATVVPRCSFVAKYLREHTVEGLRVDWAASGREPGGRGAGATDGAGGAGV